MQENLPDDSENNDSRGMIMVLLRMLVLGAVIFILAAVIVMYLHETHLNNLLVWLHETMPNVIKLLNTKHQYL